LPHTVDEILDSVVLITGAANQEFGTGFAVRCEEGATWIVTCAHVVTNVGKGGTIRVRDRDAEQVCCGELEGIDLAVLRVPGLEMQPLRLECAGGKGMVCGVAGFASLRGKRRRAELLDVTLGSRVVFEGAEQPRVEAWRLEIEGKTLLESGYSGSPVVCAATQAVFAVAGYEESQGTRGCAVSLAHLQEVWPAMPAGLFGTPPSVSSGWLAPEQRWFLEALFQQSLVTDEQLRDWCLEAMPWNEPHSIPLDSNRLDLLAWLMKKGPLAGGQIPLLSVLRKFRDWVTDKAMHARLDQLINQIAHHFGITPEAMRESKPVKTSTSPVLMLQIWPVAPSGNRYNIQAQLFYSAEINFNVYVREENNAVNVDNKEEQTKVMEDLRKEFRKRLISERQIIVELILSYDLLSHPVEWWENEAEEPLGVLSPVVVRSRERLLNAVLQDQQNCWKALLNPPDKVLLQNCWGYEKDSWREARDKLEQGFCIVFRFVPDLRQDRKLHDLYYLVDIGMPVAIWPRRNFPIKLEQYLTDKLLADLPELVRILRDQLCKESEKEKKKKEDHPCYHLTLLWDDPDRRLPKDQYYPPGA